MTKLKELKKQMIEMQNKFAQDGKAALKEAFKDFFIKNPVITEVQWKQYTPYFNDGDTCTFRVHEMYPVFVLTDEQKEKVSYEDEAEDVFYTLNSGKKTKLTLEQKDALKSFKELANDLDRMDDLFLTVFDDHVKIKATINGFEVTEYDHD